MPSMQSIVQLQSRLAFAEKYSYWLPDQCGKIAELK